MTRDKRYTQTQDLHRTMVGDPTILKSVGLDDIAVMGGGVQGIVFQSRTKSNKAYKLLLTDIQSDEAPKGVAPVNSALYHIEGGLTINDNYTVLLRPDQAIHLQSAMGEIVYLGMVKGLSNVQQINTESVNGYNQPLPERKLLTVNQQFATLYSFTKIPGETLEHHLTKKDLSPLELLQIQKDISKARFGIASRGIVHRDIKPSNIIITPEKEAHLIEFGVSYALDSKKLPDPVRDRFNLVSNTQLIRNIVRGTLPYVPPEVIPSLEHPFGIITPQVDMFAQGAIFFRTITDKTPIEDLVKNTFKHQKDYLRAICDYNNKQWVAHRDILAKEINGELAEAVAYLFHPDFYRRSDHRFTWILDQIISGREQYERSEQIQVPKNFQNEKSQEVGVVNEDAATLPMSQEFFARTLPNITPPEFQPSQAQQTSP